MKKQLLFVDDDPPVLASLKRVLRSQQSDWEMTFADHALAAWERLLQSPFDAVVTDVCMPEVSGLELLERIRQTEQTRNIPVVVLTGLGDDQLKQRALELGASDLFHKPVKPGELVARLNGVLSEKLEQDRLRSLVDMLQRCVRQQGQRLVQTRLEMICRLANVAEWRDAEMGNHVVRVGCYSRAVAAQLGFDRAAQEFLLLAAPLHDIGKIGVPDRILFKPGPLTPGERTVMEKHCVIGERMLRDRTEGLIPQLDSHFATDRQETWQDPVLDLAATIALTHHEHWNGAGYPMGLSDRQIPLESRIVAICDVFDALTSRRPYKQPSSEEDSLKILDDKAGSHFDPTVHAAFRQAWPEIRSIRARFADGVPVFSEFEEDFP